MVIDHHASNTGFGTIHLVDPAAAATAILVLDLIDYMDIELTMDIALGLYAGLVTDTGSFKFSATTPAVHLVAARLLSTGIDPGAVSQQLWDRAPFSYLGLLSVVLARATLEPAAAAGHGLVWTTVSCADRAAHGLSLDAVEPVIDVVRRTDEAYVAVVLKQSDDGRWQVSARSRGRWTWAGPARAGRRRAQERGRVHRPGRPGRGAGAAPPAAGRGLAGAGRGSRRLPPLGAKRRSGIPGLSAPGRGGVPPLGAERRSGGPGGSPPRASMGYW